MTAETEQPDAVQSIADGRQSDVRARMRAVAEVRAVAIEALAEVVRTLEPHGSTERGAIEQLHSELSSRGLRGHWYPAGDAVGASQYGCIVAFDTPAFPKRTATSSFRTLAASGEVRWEGVGYFYASPQLEIDGEVIWGDIGCLVFTDSDQEGREVVRKVWKRNQEVLSRLALRLNPTTRDLFDLNEQFSREAGLTNIAWSQSGQSLNIGHDLPRADVQEAATRRSFIDGGTNLPLRDGIWTYESRDSSAPYRWGSVQFHEMLTFGPEGLVRFPSYQPVFEVAGMEWLLH